MRTGTVLSAAVAAAPLLASAAPLTSSSSASATPATAANDYDTPETLTLAAIASGQTFNNTAINAFESYFYINHAPSTTCIVPPPYKCPPGNETVISVGTGGASMFVDVPGDQPIYVDPRSGALGYAPPHDEDLPHYGNDTVTGFNFTKTSTTTDPVTLDLVITGWYTFNGDASQGWLACPVDKSNTKVYNATTSTEVWQVFANVSGFKNAQNCVQIQIEGTVYADGTPNANEYD